MARPPSDHLTALLADVAADPALWEIMALVRAADRAQPDGPRTGTSLDPAEESIDLGHQASVDFPRTTIAAFETERRRPIVRSQHLGLTGSMGPLPLHLTEMVIHERTTPGTRPLGDFLDMISARMLQAFYRAWAASDPCTQADRPADDRFASYIGAISGGAGLRFVTGAERPPHGDAGFDDWRRLAYGGHFAGLRSAAALGDMLGHVLQRPVEAVETVGRWRLMPADSRSRIGRKGGHNTLGQGATLGARYYAVEWDVAFNVRAHSMADLDRLLPGGDVHALLVEACGAMLPKHLEWEARIEMDERAIKPARLGRTRLGMTSWVAPRRRDTVRRDVRVAGQRPVPHDAHEGVMI